MPTKTEAKIAAGQQNAKDAAQSVDSDIDELRNDLKALRGDLSKLLSDTGSYASAKSREGLRAATRGRSSSAASRARYPSRDAEPRAHSMTESRTCGSPSASTKMPG